MAEITRCKYSQRNINSNIGPLYSVEYPATTSDSVSAWSKGARLDSRKSTTKKQEAKGAYIIIYQYEDCESIKSWKFADWELNTNKE
jgi:hypothetical protein